jgi:hypothetical protein
VADENHIDRLKQGVKAWNAWRREEDPPEKPHLDLTQLVVGGRQYSVWVTVSKRDGKDYASSQIIPDIAQDPFMATVYRR